MLRITIAIMLLLGALPAQATEAGWALLRNGGHVVLLRNAMTTGTVEPPNFDIEKCATQLNLSDRGRQQARKIGALFAARAAPLERVLASRYCRTLDTARLAFGDRLVDRWPARRKAACAWPHRLLVLQVACLPLRAAPDGLTKAQDLAFSCPEKPIRQPLKTMRAESVPGS
jgi:hypothetical protein